MLRVVLHGLEEDADADGLAVLIADATTVGTRAARAQVGRLREGDTVILTLEAKRLPSFLRHAKQLGVESADMLVGRTDE